MCGTIGISDLLVEGRHAGHEQHGPELNCALHVEVGERERVQELLEGQLEELVVFRLLNL